MTKTWYDYETESGNKLMFPRMHFRNMNNVGALMGFPFKLIPSKMSREQTKHVFIKNKDKLKYVTKNDPSLYQEPYDTYMHKDTEILVIGGDTHCHVGKELGKYKEGIVFFCDETDKEDIIKQIKKVA